MTQIGDVYSDQNHIDFFIIPEWPDDVQETPATIEPEYGSPAISVDSSARFATHEIIGGKTVRQKIGEDPVEVDIGGVCKESVARQFDSLRNAKYGSIHSKRFTGDSMTVNFASVSTSPMEDGGAVDLSDSTGNNSNTPQLLYTYDLSCVEVKVGVSTSDNVDDGNLGEGELTPTQ